MESRCVRLRRDTARAGRTACNKPSEVSTAKRSKEPRAVVRRVAVLPQGKRRGDLQSWLYETLRPWLEGRILPVTVSIVEPWRMLAGLCRLKGTDLKMADGLIAATAIAHNLTIATRNVKDFAGLGVTLLNPWDAV